MKLAEARRLCEKENGVQFPALLPNQSHATTTVMISGAAKFIEAKIIEAKVITDRGLIPYSEWLRDPKRAPGWPYAHP